MIRGLLCNHGAQTLHLVFICPGCGKQHGCLVDDVCYSSGGLNVWAYKMIEDNKIIELYPSFDNSAYCGYHSDYNWKVEIMYLDEGQERNEATEKWLHRLTK